MQGISIKEQYLRACMEEYNNDPKGLVYVGNDLNDLPAILYAGFSAAPSDAHLLIRQHATVVLKQKGGDGFVRAFIEMLLGLDRLSVDQVSQFFSSSTGVIK